MLKILRELGLNRNNLPSIRDVREEVMVFEDLKSEALIHLAMEDKKMRAMFELSRTFPDVPGYRDLYGKHKTVPGGIPASV